MISSDENCVIYDLEKNIRVEDATSYSYDTIVESYFDTDKYSTKVKMKLAEYEQLFLRHQLSTKEKERLHYLERYFQNAPKELAPELEVKLQQIQL